MYVFRTYQQGLLSRPCASRVQRLYSIDFRSGFVGKSASFGYSHWLPRMYALLVTRAVNCSYVGRVGAPLHGNQPFRCAYTLNPENGPARIAFMTLAFQLSPGPAYNRPCECVGTRWLRLCSLTNAQATAYMANCRGCIHDIGETRRQTFVKLSWNIGKPHLFGNSKFRSSQRNFI